MLTIAITPDQVEAALAAGELVCPACSGPLSPWGYAGSRVVRLRHQACSVTPRRAQCRACESTQVISYAWLVPRRRDGVEVIGEALRLAAGGVGHRAIARQLDRPGTVRGWLRAARRRAEGLRACATRWTGVLDPEIGTVNPAGVRLATRWRRSRSPSARGCCGSAAQRAGHGSWRSV